MDKKERLEKELKKMIKKLGQLKVDWAETKSGSMYGSEYIEIQIKVYTAMIEEVKKELQKLKT